MVELLPCPACGSPAAWTRGCETPPETYVQCTNQKCFVHDVRRDVLPSEWNRRATPAPIAQAQGDEAWIRANERPMPDDGPMSHPSDEPWMVISSEKLRAYLASRPSAPVVPAGWKLVPVEPTRAMLEAGAKGSGEDSETVARGAWDDMIDAAPSVGGVPCPRCEEYDQVLRGLASFVGAGGYNSEGLIHPRAADDKLRWGILAMVKAETRRQLSAPQAGMGAGEYARLYAAALRKRIAYELRERKNRLPEDIANLLDDCCSAFSLQLQQQGSMVAAVEAPEIVYRWLALDHTGYCYGSNPPDNLPDRCCLKAFYAQPDYALAALHEIAHSKNLTATPQQFADHLQREAKRAPAPQPGQRPLCEECGGTGYARQARMGAGEVEALIRSLEMQAKDAHPTDWMVRGHDVRALVASQLSSVQGALPSLTYTNEIGEAGQRYFDSFKFCKVTTPATFRFNELWDRMVAAALARQLSAAPDVVHWAASNPGLADQYRAEALACRRALGFDADADDVAPVDLTNAIAALPAQPQEHSK